MIDPTKVAALLDELEDIRFKVRTGKCTDGEEQRQAAVQRWAQQEMQKINQRLQDCELSLRIYDQAEVSEYWLRHNLMNADVSAQISTSDQIRQYSEIIEKLRKQLSERLQEIEDLKLANAINMETIQKLQQKICEVCLATNVDDCYYSDDTPKSCLYPPLQLASDVDALRAADAKRIKELEDKVKLAGQRALVNSRIAYRGFSYGMGSKDGVDSLRRAITRNGED